MKNAKIMMLPALLFASLVLSQTVHADCKAAYASEVKRMDGMLNPARTAFAASGATAIAVPVTLAVTGAAMAPAAIVVAPAAVAGATVFFGVVSGLKKSYQSTLQLIKNAEAGHGKYLSKFTRKIQRSQPEVTEQEVAAAVVEANQNNEFCVERENGSTDLLLRLKIRKLITGKLTLLEE